MSYLLAYLLTYRLAFPPLKNLALSDLACRFFFSTFLAFHKSKQFLLIIHRNRL